MRGEVVGLRSTTSAGQTGASRPKRLRKSWVDRIEWVEPLSLGREDAARFLELGQLGACCPALQRQGGCPDNWTTGAAIGFTGAGLEQ